MKKEIEQSYKDKLISFTKKGFELEANIYRHKESNRSKSIKNYGQKLLNSRLIMLSIIYELIKIKEGIPGKTSESISQRIHLIATYVQGVDITETAISEAQYSKATAIEKQNYELLTRIIEVKKGVAKEGRTPQIKNLPEKFRRIYGDLNKVAHPSNSNVIENLIRKIESGESKGISYIPKFDKNISKILYELHLIIMYYIIIQNIELLVEMYGVEIIKELVERDVFKFFQIVKDNLLNNGVIIE